MPTETLKLRDIHLPNPVSWWPPATGWWLVLFAMIFFTLFGFWLWKRWQKKNRSAKILARKELEQIYKQFRQEHDQKQLIENLSVLLRRSSLSVFPRHESAGLTGEKWLQFLDKVMQSQEFSQGVGRSLITAPYVKEPDISSEKLFALCKDWVEALP